MALLCYAHNLCLHLSLRNCCYCSYKVIFINDNWYISKRENSSNSNSSSGKSLRPNLNEESQDNLTVPEVPVKKDENASYADDLNALEEPTTCCMSGCANCVWIEYAEELSKRFKDGGDKARESIMKIEDPNMRAFLLTELKNVKK